MFSKLTISECYDITVRDLVSLKNSGHSVYRTSHAGNWSLYKLLLSQIGLPDCIWDITCIHRDINNQPQYQLLNGQKNFLLNSNPKPPVDKTKFLTPYFRVLDSDQTLANFHMEPLKKMFGSIITSQSEVLLEYEDELRVVFEIIQNHYPEQLGRYVLPCGCMVPLHGSGGVYHAKCMHNHHTIKQSELASSAIETLKEIKNLVWNPIGYQPKGGVLYSFELVVSSFYLWSFWKFGDRTIYELSGPDMIGYATKAPFISRVEKVLKLISKYIPENLMPKTFEAKIVPTTLFLFGYPDNHEVAKKVSASHETIRIGQKLKRQWKEIDEITKPLNSTLASAIEIIEKHRSSWDLFHNPSKDAFYSQHDMMASGARMVIQEDYLGMPFSMMGTILQNLAQMEKSLARQFLSVQQ